MRFAVDDGAHPRMHVILAGVKRIFERVRRRVASGRRLLIPCIQRLLPDHPRRPCRLFKVLDLIRRRMEPDRVC